MAWFLVTNAILCINGLVDRLCAEGVESRRPDG